MLGLFSGEADLEDISRKLKSANIREEDNITMKGIFSQTWDEGKIEGKTEGEAKKMVEYIEKAMKKLNLTLGEACDIFDVTESKYEEAKKMLAH